MPFKNSCSLSVSLLLSYFGLSSMQLIVNVKNNGGEVIQEIIDANTTADTIKLSFNLFDGTSVTQFIDFKNEVQIFRAVILGEEERGEPPYQVLCFVVPFLSNEFITSDAMSKLRQKNADAIRHPEEEKDQEQFGLDVRLTVETSGSISQSIQGMCAEARDRVFSNETFLSKIAARWPRPSGDLFSTLTTKRTSFRGLPECTNTTDTTRPCICNYQICVGWYPCALKYCKGKDSAGKTVSYRCGIKTCKKCRQFRFYTPQKLNCMWDEDFTDYFKDMDVVEQNKNENFIL